MGSGRWDSDTYHKSSVTRASLGTKDFAYSEKAKITHTLHDSLDPRRINGKVKGVLESRDSDEHPNSVPFLVCFDVTGSNIERAEVAQKHLPKLMEMLQKYFPDVQVATASNDDYTTSGRNCIQISEFESDVRIDEHLRNTWLVGQGGANAGESYDLLFYAAARKIATDCYEKRKQKGFMFVYADEPIFSVIEKAQVEDVFGDKLQADIPLADIIKEVEEKWNIIILFPYGGYADAHKQWKDLFGTRVITLQDPSRICEQIAAVAAMESVKDAKKVTEDLKQLGVADAEAIVTATGKAGWKGGKEAGAARL